MPSAIVTGATGILGRAIVNQLSANPKQWTQIHALSRSKKAESASNVSQTNVDLMSDATAMASALSGIKEVDYVFFSAYLAQDTEEGATKVNGDMLQNFLTALETTGLLSTIKRIVLVTGCKQYGVHLGPVKNPMQESDPWLRDEKKYPPNFYYRQQDILSKFCADKAGGRLSWTVTYPNDVIGFAKDNFMNLATSLGLYAVVSREMGADESGLVFPGSPSFYTGYDSLTCAKLHARFCEWAALEPKAANEAFNVVNGDVESYQNLFPKLANRFGLKVKEDQFVDSSLDAQGSTSELQDPPPISEFEASAGLKGKIRRGKLDARVDLVQWSQRADVKETWDKIATREGLEKDAFEKATWAFLGFVLGRSYDMIINMNKARELGWTGFQDTWKSLDDVFDTLEREKILPKRK